MRRLFTFGCSFTTHAWPTWATIMAYDTNYEFYNYALPGLGNFGIANRILEADLKHNFTDEDIICIMWSSWDREDRIINEDYWQGRGSFYVNPDYGKDFLKKTVNQNHSLVQNSYSIHSANKMYGDKISWQSTWSGWFNNDVGGDKFEPDSKIKNMYAKVLPNVFKWNIDIKKKAYGSTNDSHPEVLDHLNLLENQLYPSLNLKLKLSTRKICHNISNELSKMVKTFPNNLYHKKITDLMENKFPEMNTPMRIVGPSILENIDE